MGKRKLASNKENESPAVKKTKSDEEKTPSAGGNELVDISNTAKSSRKSTASKRKATAAAAAADNQEADRIPIKTEIDANFKSLNECLRNLSKCGDYSVDGEATEMPKIVGLEVKDFGPVSLPLRDPQASALINLCQKAPYGFNQKTLIDQNVRDSYQLDPSRVEITNPEWNVKLNDLVARVAKGLGCHAKVEAKLYKMLIYKEGGHFLKHRDTEKEKQMFATLIIQLPSVHKGGELVVYENNGRSKKVIDFGQKENKNEFSMYFAAHYADLEHELLEVKSGYRLALVYSLCWVNGNKGCFTNASISNQLLPVFDILNRKEYHLGIILDHQYTSQSFQKNGARALKGIDNDWFNLLDHVNSRLPPHRQLSFYVCHASLVISSYDTNMADSDYEDNEHDWEENERTTELNWYNINGQPVFNECDIELSFFTKIFSPLHKKNQDVDLDDEKAWGKHVNLDIEYTGNEGTNKTTEYSRYLLVIWPKSFEFDTLINLDCKLAIDSLHKRFVETEHQLSASERAELEKLFSQLLNKIGEQDDNLPRDATLKTLRIIETINKREYFNQFLDVEKPVLSKPIGDQLAKLIAHFGFDAEMKMSLDNVVDPIRENIVKNSEFLESLINENQKKVADQFIGECMILFAIQPETMDVIVRGLARGEHMKLARSFLKCIPEFLDFFKEATLRTILSERVTSSNLISSYLKEKETFADCVQIRQMFEERLRVLQIKLKHLPPFSWKMQDAKLPEHQRVEAFLRSDHESIVFTAPFRYVKDLRSFVSKYNGCKKFTGSFGNYSVVMEERPSKTVLIKKTRDWYNLKHGDLAKCANEYEMIKSFLDNRQN